MYCIKCGVKLAETEKKCPLCNTAVCHPDYENIAAQPLYPENKMPKNTAGTKVLNGAVIILFLIPLLVCFLADFSLDGKLEWAGYVMGALLMAYVTFALPQWFYKPNPVIFVPCSFASAALYLLYINLATRGGWFLGFALPVVAGVCLITCAVVTLLRYLRKGRLYIIGGALIALGGLMLLVERWMNATFCLRYMGWAMYPCAVLGLLGGLLIYLAINTAAREILERKFFF